MELKVAQHGRTQLRNLLSSQDAPTLSNLNDWAEVNMALDEVRSGPIKADPQKTTETALLSCASTIFASNFLTVQELKRTQKHPRTLARLRRRNRTPSPVLNDQRGSVFMCVTRKCR